MSWEDSDVARGLGTLRRLVAQLLLCEHPGYAGFPGMLATEAVAGGRTSAGTGSGGGYDDADLATFVANALSPAKVTSAFVLDAGTKAVRALVPDYQLSLAIGKEGQNARLAAKLTGAKIDIQPDSVME